MISGFYWLGWNWRGDGLENRAAELGEIFPVRLTDPLEGTDVCLPSLMRISMIDTLTQTSSQGPLVEELLGPNRLSHTGKMDNLDGLLPTI